MTAADPRLRSSIWSGRLTCSRVSLFFRCVPTIESTSCLSNYVGEAIVTIHQKAEPAHGIYHLSSGTGSQTYREITTALAAAGSGHRPAYVPSLGRPFSATVDRLSNGKGSIGHGAALLKVFWPYLDWNTVFDNSRVVAELNEAPAKFTSYCLPALRFSRANKFRYPARPWPAAAPASAGKSVVAEKAHA